MKTFDGQEEICTKFSYFCKEHRISIAKQIELFMESMIETELEAKREYFEKPEEIRKEKFIRVKNFAEYYRYIK